MSGRSLLECGTGKVEMPVYLERERAGLEIKGWDLGVCGAHTSVQMKVRDHTLLAV